MKDREFLIWILQRLMLYDTSATFGTDYVTKLASIIDRTHKDQLSPNIASSERVKELVRG
jgi:hypothetical protein